MHYRISVMGHRLMGGHSSEGIDAVASSRVIMIRFTEVVRLLRGVQGLNVCGGVATSGWH